MRSDPPSGPADRVVLGRVSRPNGLSGAVVVQIDPSLSDVLTRGLEIELVPRTGSPIRTRIRSAAPIRGGVRVTLDDVNDRNASEALVGATVSVERTALHFDDEEFLESDVLGIEVFGEDGFPLGSIVEIVKTGANDVYVARAGEGPEILIPAVGHAVLGVDLETRRMTVDRTALEYSAPTAGTPMQDSTAPGDAGYVSADPAGDDASAVAVAGDDEPPGGGDDS